MAMVFIGLVGYAVLDTFLLNKLELTPPQVMQLLQKPSTIGGLLLAVPLLAILAYRFLRGAKIPYAESMALSLLLTAALVAASLPALKRVDQYLVNEVPQSHAYRASKEGNLVPIEASLNLPDLWVSPFRLQGHIVDGHIIDVQLIHGPLGFWQLDRKQLEKALSSKDQDPPTK